MSKHICPRCGKAKPIEQFYRLGYRSTDCAPCNRRRLREIDEEKANRPPEPEHVRRLKELESDYRARQYSLDLAEDRGDNQESLNARKKLLEEIEAEIQQLRAMPAEPAPVQVVQPGSIRSGHRSRNAAVIYRVRHISSGLIKIGITGDWSRRSTELRIGYTTELLGLTEAETLADAREIEQRAHKLIDSERLPQSEWFHISEPLSEMVLIEARFRALLPSALALVPTEQFRLSARVALKGLREFRHQQLRNWTSGTP